MTLWHHLKDLPLSVEGYALERLDGEMAHGFHRVTTHIRLQGEGEEGIGEDVGGPDEKQHEAFRAAAPLPLTGRWTLEAFCDHLATLDSWPEPPEWEAARLYRNWAFESAALDLALRQAGRPLHDVLGREPRPMSFVNSLGLGEPPSLDTIHRRLGHYPGLRFKLDAAPHWTEELMAELAATGAVESIDFKGHYGFEVEDPEALLGLYDRVLAIFPEAFLEDPHDLPDVAERLQPHLDRVSYDAPIHTVEDVRSAPLAARNINVKPSRTGGLRPLLELYAHCEAEGLAMYGGGMGELGVGRGQAQLLASLFHPDAPNDVAPGGFNAHEPGPGLSTSPLDPRPDASGFRRVG